MAELSPNLGLNLPVGSDRFDYDKFLRQNFQILDDKVGKSTTEVFDATEGQTVFTLSNSYALGTDSLSVEVDGVKQALGSGYTETSTTSITFSEPLVAGAKVKVVILGLDQGQDNRFDQIESSLAQKETQINSMLYHPEQYGAVGDGIADDTVALQNFIADCLLKGKAMELNGNYKITSLLTIDGVSKKVNFIVNGHITASGSAVLFKNIIGGTQKVRLKNGGTGSATSIGVQTSNCVGITLEVYGDAYAGIVLKAGGNRQDTTHTSISNVRLICRNGCYQALEHGDNISGKYQDAFGTYEYIYDLDSLNGIVFQNSNDITIKHIENHFYDTTNTKDGLTFNTCGAVHGENIAIGGRAMNNMNIIASVIDINKLYTVNEDVSTLVTNGVTVDNTSTLIVHFHKDSRGAIALNIPTVGGVIKFNSMLASGSTSVVKAGGTDLQLPLSTLTQYSNVGFLTSYNVKPATKTSNNMFKFVNLTDNNKTHYTVGESASDNTFRVEVYDINTGAWKSVPIQIDKDGNVRLGVSNTLLGFYGAGGAVKQTVSGSKGGNAALQDLITKLASLGLITDGTTA